MTSYCSDPEGTDDQRWFERPGHYRKRRIRPMTDEERKHFREFMPGDKSNFVVVSWIEDGLLAYNSIIIPDGLIDYVLAHDDCVEINPAGKNFRIRQGAM